MSDVAGPDDPTVDFGPAPPRPVEDAAPAGGRRAVVLGVCTAALVIGGVAGLSVARPRVSGPSSVEWSRARAEALVSGPGGRQRYRLGSPGDRLLVGDWDCDGEVGPALYRPSTGETFVFDGWANGSAPSRVEHLDPGAEVAVVTDGHGCDHLVARPPSRE